jgi:hypothetical protein
VHEQLMSLDAGLNLVQLRTQVRVRNRQECT